MQAYNSNVQTTTATTSMYGPGIQSPLTYPGQHTGGYGGQPAYNHTAATSAAPAIAQGQNYPGYSDYSRQNPAAPNAYQQPSFK